MDLLERAFKDQCEFRICNQKCSQFIATFSDFDDLLRKASTGYLLQELAFVIPIASGITDEELQGNQIWKSARTVFGNDSCHRIEHTDHH